MASAKMNTKGVKRNIENEACTSYGHTVEGNKRLCISAADRRTDQRSLHKAKLLMSQVIRKLHSFPHSNVNEEFIQYIESMISKLDATSKKKTTVGVFGKSGVGKSSLINTILGEEDLLPSGTITACTSVIIQVEFSTTDSNYTAEIDFIPKEEWEEEVKKHLDALSQAKENDEDEDEDEDEDTLSTGQEKVEAVYGDIRRNATLEELMDEQNFAAIPEFLVSSKKRVSCTTAAELSEEINHFTRSDDTSPGQYFWPLVKTVTIKIPFGKSFDNIALIDLPGTGDFNKSRDEMWKKCLSRCSTVWIVNDMNRAATDKEPWKILTSCVKDMGHGGECNSITFICTKTDDINPTKYVKNYKLKDEDLDVTASKDSVEYGKQLERACILHRNEKAKEKVRTMFSKQTDIQNHFTCDEDFFKVFTVSSQVFQQREEKCILTQEDTEIPKLWGLLEKLDNSCQKTSVKDYIQGAHGILSLIQGANSNASETLEVKHDVLRALKQNLVEELDYLKAFFIRQSDHLELCLSEGVTESENLSLETADKDVIKTKIKDARGYHRTLKALCENNGFRRTKNGLMIDLNASLATHMYKRVDGQFQNMFPWNDPVTGKPDKSIRGMLHRFNIINSDITELYGESPVSLNLTFIKTQQNRLISRIEDNIFERKKRIYTSLYESILCTMQQVYPEAAKVFGRNSFTAKQKLLIDHIEKSKPDMFTRAKTTMLELFENLTEYIENTLREELDSIITLALTNKDGVPLPDINQEVKEMESLASSFVDLQP
ncbi:nuclear GTPase SLIP-GC-like [Alosa sapidissima]|uniref:nuclear GTPase SLIP-GC-like n=1 Tax=Alosa sapidissima TaxID=34773 RepID=UPI001C095588|nr:nuclear GTPase SLIP-GC-like [Alosa sapidissima]XP_041939889.1 nuclear GTPase SLIP-GC-like [Alosa sapidissima]